MIRTKALPIKSAGIYGLTSALNGGVQFLLVPVLTRHMVPRDYGIAAIFITVTLFLGAFTGLSVQSAINVRYFEQDRYDFRKYVAACLWILLVSTLVVAVLTLLLPASVEAALGLSPGLLALAALCSGAQFLINVRLTLWQVEFRAGRYASFQLATTALNVTLTILLVVTFSGGWSGRVIAQASAMLGSGAFALWGLARAGYVKNLPSREYIRDALRFGVPLIPHTIGGLLIALADRLVIVSILGLDAAGIYASGAQIGMVMGMAADAVNRAYNPWLLSQLKQAEHESKQHLVRLTYLYFLALLSCVAVYAALAPWLFEYVVGSRYLSAYSISIWVALGGAFQAMYYMVALYIVYAGKTHYLAGVTLTGGLLNLPLTIALVSEFGTLGAAYAYAATQALFFAATWVMSQRSFPMPWRTALI